jgi:N-methylhydantoinase A
MTLDADAARRAMQEGVADRLGLSAEDAALAVMQVATENMVSAIEEITVNQGIDPRKASSWEAEARPG